MHRSPWAENGRQWLSRRDPTQTLSADEQQMLFGLCTGGKVSAGWSTFVSFIEDLKGYWGTAHVLSLLPPGRYRAEERGYFCGPCLETWTPHSGRLGRPALWWVWRGSELCQNLLRLYTNNRAKHLKIYKCSNISVEQHHHSQTIAYVQQLGDSNDVVWAYPTGATALREK